MYYQKYKEAKQMTRQQQNHEESYASGGSESEEDDDEEDEEGERTPEIDMKKIAQADNHRRGKSMHTTASRRPATANPSNTAKQKQGLKSTLKNAFRNFF